MPDEETKSKVKSESNQDEVEEDYTTKAELDSLLNSHPLPKEHKAFMTYFSNLSAREFFDRFFADNAPDCLTKFYH